MIEDILDYWKNEDIWNKRKILMARVFRGDIEEK